MQTALKFARNNEFGICWLRVLENNASAIAFYRRGGFVEVGRKLYPAGEMSVTVLVMARYFD
jgi:ribosomal protein S18 acetylase RimI-like enzyme